MSTKHTYEKKNAHNPMKVIWLCKPTEMMTQMMITDCITFQDVVKYLMQT